MIKPKSVEIKAIFGNPISRKIVSAAIASTKVL
jgi:hypothetical protein